MGVGFEWDFPYSCTGWANAFNLTYPLIDDAAYKIVNALEIPNVPFTVIVDQNRVVQYASYGFDEQLIANKIDSLLTVSATLGIRPYVSELISLQPVTIFLAQPYPNPFNPATTISYTLRQAGVARLEVMDLRGRIVTTLMQGWQDSGNHQIVWDAGDLASGAYFIRLNFEGVVNTRKVILSK